MKISAKSLKLLPLKELTIIFNILGKEGQEPRLIGGCVRDLLMGRAIKDFDIATPLEPAKCIELLKENQIKAIPTELKYGTITAIVNGKTFEITTLRRDIECFGRKAEVEFTNNWKADAMRRDFTINALSLDLEGNLYDYAGVSDDIQTKTVRFIGDPSERIREDYLRILRYFRFIAYFGTDNLHEESLKAAVSLMPEIKVISGERIKLEMFKILGATHSKETILLMIGYDLLEYLKMPKINQKSLREANFSDSPIINLVLLLKSNPEVGAYEVKRVAKRFRVSNKEFSTLRDLVCFREKIDFAKPLSIQEQYLYYYGKEFYIHYLKLTHATKPLDNHKILLDFAKSTVLKKLPITGHDVVALGFQGKEVGKVLKKAQKCWVNNNFKPDRERLLQFIAAGCKKTLN